MKFRDWITALTTFYVGEVSDDGDDFLGGSDDDDTDDAEDDAGEQDDLDTEDDAEDSDEEDEEDSEDDEDEDEDIESDDDSASSGDGDEEDGGSQVLARALKEATRARLLADAGADKGQAALDVYIPTVKDLQEVPGLKDVDEGDLTTIHQIVASVVQSAITNFHEKAVLPIRTTAVEKARKDKLVADLQSFNQKYPQGLHTHQDAMAELWDEFQGEFGRDGADSISFEDLFIMAGGKGKAAATKKVKGVAKKLAKDQKSRASRGSQQVGRVGKVRSSKGGKRRGKGDSDAAAAVKHIRSTQVDPFIIR